MPSGTDRLTRAKHFITKGDEYYALAAALIVEEHDSGTSYTDIAARVGKSRMWVKRLAESWRARTPESAEPFAVDWERGSHATAEEIRQGVVQTLREPLSRQEAIDSLTPGERARLVAATLDDDATREAVGADPEAATAVGRTHLENTQRDLGEQREQRAPIGHFGWTPRRWMADALFLLWRLQNRLVDDQPPTEGLREELQSMVDEARRHLDRIEAMSQGDTVLDQELAAAVARWETEFNR